MSSHHDNRKDTERLPEATAKKVQTIAFGVAGLGVALSAVGFMGDKQRFAFSFLTGFEWITTLGLGALFFVMIQHVTRAGWSVAPRRHAEWLTSILWVVPILFFIGVYPNLHTLYEHWLGEHAAHDAIVKAKQSYLNVGFFTGRAVLFFAIWGLLAWFFQSKSREQDTSGDTKLTEKMQALAAPGLALFALSQTFAGFDWVMSMDPHWYSTIFGVYMFAGGVVAALSVLAIINIRLQSAGLLQKVSTVEHQHDIGKLLFGFTVFWTYIAFSQYFLIWYGNIPEETIFFKHRWVESWKDWSMLLLVGHFIVPVVVLMSRHTKRNKAILTVMAVWMLVMHYVDMYWLVMPNLDHHGVHFTLGDLGALLLCGGLGFALVARRAAQSPIFPLKDPRLAEAYKVENL